MPSAWRAVAGLVAALPGWALEFLVGAMAFLAGTVFRVRRHHVEDAMRRAGIADPSREASRMYGRLAKGAVEFLAAAGGRDQLVVEVDPASEARLQAARAKGRGIVIAASHTGNWDLAACAIAGRLELCVVTKNLRLSALDAFWQDFRRGRGVRLVAADGALTHGRRTLENGGAVAMMIDQVPSRQAHAVQEMFLGAPVAVDRSAAVLARRAQAPLVVAAAHRSEDRLVLSILDVLEPDSGPARVWVDETTRRATRLLSEHVLRHPADWLWLHRRWRQPARA
jgi:KDO2-lipid IV(A) lauroyltransferase